GVDVLVPGRRVHVGVAPEPGDTRGIVGAALGRLLRRQAADGAEARGGLRRRRAVVDQHPAVAEHFADEDRLRPAELGIPDRRALLGGIEAADRGGRVVDGRDRVLEGTARQVAVVAGVDVADAGHVRARARRIGRVRGHAVDHRVGVRVAPGRGRQTQPVVLGLALAAAAAGEAGGRRGRPGEVAQPLVQHLRDRVAPHAAFAVPQGAAALGFAVAADPVGRVRPVPVGVAVEVVGDPAVVAAADHAQAVDAADDAFDVGAEDARVRIDLAVEVLDVAAQDAAFEVVRLRPGGQAAEHLPGLAIVVEDAGRLVDRVVGRAVGLAHALAQVGICVPATAGLHPDQVILAAGRARAVLPEQAPAVVAGGLFVAELDGVDARAERDA